MLPVGFPEQNEVLHAPQGEESRCYDLGVYRNDELLISCWAPTPDERERIATGAPVFLVVQGQTHPPLYLTLDAFCRSDDPPAPTAEARRSMTDEELEAADSELLRERLHHTQEVVLNLHGEREAHRKFIAELRARLQRPPAGDIPVCRSCAAIAAALRRVERSGRKGVFDGVCPVCGFWPHVEGCELAAALGLIPEPTPPETPEPSDGEVVNAGYGS